jgi:TonB family protein
LRVRARIGLAQTFEESGLLNRAYREYRLASGEKDSSGRPVIVLTPLTNRTVAGRPNPLLIRWVNPPSNAVVTSSQTDYSTEAQIARLEGVLRLLVTVAPDGFTGDVHVLDPIGLGLDESAVQVASKWIFIPQTSPQSPFINFNSLIALNGSRWHLTRVAFDAPAGTSRPHFLSAVYPTGSGITARGRDAAQMIAAMNRQESVTISFDVNEAGQPVNLRAQRAAAPMWGEEAIGTAAKWKFSPGMKDATPISVPCTVDLVWYDGIFTLDSLLTPRF